MAQSSNDLASWASILGAAATILGLIQSATWLTAIGLCLTVVAVFALVEARKGQRQLRSAAINVEGRNIDSLNVANLRRRLNQDLVVQRAYHLARIKGRDLEVACQFAGYCNADKVTSIEFSIDSDSSTPFGELECYAHDCMEDPQCLHRIKPILVGGDGLSKKIAVPFLKPPRYQQPFSVVLHCKLAGCLGPGVDYYTATLSFEQRSIESLVVHLVFVHDRPEWLRVYECDPDGQPILLKDLRPFKEDRRTTEYLDIAEDVSGQCSRIYVFHRTRCLVNTTS